MTLLTYTHGSHFISALQLADQNLRSIRKDEANIRWIVIGLHDALYALLIEKLTRSDGFGIFSDNFERKVADFYTKGLDSASPEFRELSEHAFSENIAGIGKLLQRANLTSGAQIKATDIAELTRPSRGLSHLKEMRDFFAHPRPMISGYFETWLIETIGDTLEVIKETLALPSHTAARHDPKEAEVILKSIEYYFSRWIAKNQSQ
jgi:hypothetical protein